MSGAMGWIIGNREDLNILSPDFFNKIFVYRGIQFSPSLKNELGGHKFIIFGKT